MAEPREEEPTPPVASAPAPPPDPSSAGAIPAAPDPVPAQLQPSADLFRCPVDSLSPHGHRAAWKPIPGATLYRVYETEEGLRELTYESPEPSVFFSTSGWVVTEVEIVWVDAEGKETPVWPVFSQGIMAKAFDQLLAVGEDATGPVLQIRDCVSDTSFDYDPALAVRSLRVPGATELRGVAVSLERGEAFLRAADRIFVLRHFTTAGSERDDSGAVRLDLAEVAASAPLGAGSALAVQGTTLYAADGNVLVRFEAGSNGWYETARSAPLSHAIQQVEIVRSKIAIVLEEGASTRLVHATWSADGLVVGESVAVPLAGSILTAVLDPDLFLAQTGGSEIVVANGNRLFTAPFGIAALAAGAGRLYVRDPSHLVTSWSLGGAAPAAFRMPAATVHAQLMLPLRAFIIE